MTFTVSEEVTTEYVRKRTVAIIASILVQATSSPLTQPPLFPVFFLLQLRLSRFDTTFPRQMKYVD